MKNLFKIFLWALLAVVAVVAAVVVIRTATYPFAPIPEVSGDAPIAALSQESVDRLAGGLRIPTVSEDVALAENNPFDRFKEYLPGVYPGIYRAMDTVTVNRYGLIFRWPGSEPELAPILLLSHYDVVPVAGYTGDPTATPDGWERPPFSGEVHDGHIYGRGTLDDKGMLFSILEAADALIAEGFRPQRDVWMAFGFDEEVSGEQGARQMAQWFHSRSMRFEAVYDEGSIITAPGIGGINAMLALIGTAEKGFLTLRITVRGQGGHASMPPPKGALVQAAEIINILNDNQMPARLTVPVASFLDNIGGAMNYTARMAIANKWLLGETLIKTLAKNPATNALVRTTTAVTMARGSDADNVLSTTAEVTVNFRLLPGDTVEDVVAHVEKLCGEYDTDITIVSAREASNISPEDTHAYDMMRLTLAKVYPQAVPAGYLAVVGTDAYKYELVSDNVYRLMPALVSEREQSMIHSENENISLDNYSRMIAYFKYLLKNY